MSRIEEALARANAIRSTASANGSAARRVIPGKNMPERGKSLLDLRHCSCLSPWCRSVLLLCQRSWRRTVQNCKNQRYGQVFHGHATDYAHAGDTVETTAAFLHTCELLGPVLFCYSSRLAKIRKQCTGIPCISGRLSYQGYSGDWPAGKDDIRRVLRFFSQGNIWYGFIQPPFQGREGR